MHKRFDDIFSALMLAAAVAVVLAGYWVLSRSIARAAEPVSPCAGQALVQPLEASGIELPEYETAPAQDEAVPLHIYHPAIPLSAELQAELHNVCAEADVPEALALGVIEVESRFQPDAVSPAGCWGLMQLHPDYFPNSGDPADNLRCGVWHLRSLLERYRDTAAALTAYNAGYDTGNREYAQEVLEAAGKWAGGAKYCEVLQ